MYIINTIPHGKWFVRYLRTRCSCIRNLTRSLRSLVRFLLRQQLVRKYRTPALSMKYSLYIFAISMYIYTVRCLYVQFRCRDGIPYNDAISQESRDLNCRVFIYAYSLRPQTYFRVVANTRTNRKK